MISSANAGNCCPNKTKSVITFNKPNQYIEGFIVNYGYATYYDIATQKGASIELLNIPFRTEDEAKLYASLLTTKDYSCFACKSTIKVDRVTIRDLLKKVQISEWKLDDLLARLRK